MQKRLNIKAVQALNSVVITTADKYTEDQYFEGSNLIDTSKKIDTVKDYQTVVSVGPLVRTIKPGDLVMINPSRYARLKHEKGSLKDGIIKDNPVVRYEMPFITLDHKTYLKLVDNDIEFIITDHEYEEVEEPKQSIIIPGNTNLIVPDGNIIV